MTKETMVKLEKYLVENSIEEGDKLIFPEQNATTLASNLFIFFNQYEDKKIKE